MRILLAAAILLVHLPALSQRTPVEESKTGGKTILKYNVAGLLLKSHNFQLERVLARKQSLAVSVGFTSNASLPFKDFLLDRYDGDPQGIDIIESFSFNRLSVTPEYRFYLGRRGAPSGFYLAPFLRYTRFDSEQRISLIDSDNSTHNVDFKGTLKGYGGGVMMGSQWSLGRSIVLDLWIIGPFYGKMTGDFTGVDSQPIKDPVGFEDDIENLDLGPWTLDATVSGQRADVKLNGPFAGMRAGLCLGFRF
jgi:hypothetical protein